MLGNSCEWTCFVNLCFRKNTKAERFTVILGKNALNESNPTVEQKFRVEKIFIHEGFDNNEGNFNNDIGVNTQIKTSFETKFLIEQSVTPASLFKPAHSCNASASCCATHFHPSCCSVLFSVRFTVRCQNSQSTKQKLRQLEITLIFDYNLKYGKNVYL